MESSPLNQAHQLERRAEALLRQHKFDECILTHIAVTKHLLDAILLTENCRAKESIQLQTVYHQKQVEAIKVKKSQYESYRKIQETMRQKVNFKECFSEKGDALQAAIFHTMVVHDSLIDRLLGKRRNSNSNDEDSPKDSLVSDAEEKSADECDGLVTAPPKTQQHCVKHQVDDSTVIEELKEVTFKLRGFLGALMDKLDERDREIVKLKAEIAALEAEKSKANSKSTSSLRVITDSSGGTSPYVFSPCSELSPEVHDIRDLPNLTPLEVPNFDLEFSCLSVNKQANSSAK